MIHAVGSTPGKGFFIASCETGQTANAERFLKGTRASFVAGYRYSVPWEEAMICDLVFLTYLLSGRTKRGVFRGRARFLESKGSFRNESSRNPLKIARWVHEDYPLAGELGFRVFTKKGRGRGSRIVGYPEA